MRATWLGLISFLFLPTALWAQTKYSILQGSTSDSVAHFTVVAPAQDDLHFEVIGRDENFAHHPTAVERVTMAGSDWVVHRMRFDQLHPADRYILRTLDAGQHVVDQRDFKTLITKTGRGRIALLSCMLRQIHNPFMWNQLAKPENRPDLMLFLGDAVYLDRHNLLWASLPTSELQVWEDWVATRNRLNVYKWQTLVPSLAVWDDHDSGGDNVTAKSFPMMQKLRAIFETFMGNEEIEGVLRKGPGLAKQFEAFGKNFIILDGRSFRELDPEYPLFGKEQEDWLIEVTKPGANLIASGTQFYGGSLMKDSLEFNWPKDEFRFTARLRAEGERIGASYAFASGDVHFSQIQHLEPSLYGYPTAEITSSSVHSMTFPGRHIFHKHNPRQTSVTSTHNVVLLELDSTVTRFAFNVRSIGWRGQNLFNEDISIGGPCEQALAPGKVP